MLAHSCDEEPDGLLLLHIDRLSALTAVPHTDEDHQRGRPPSEHAAHILKITALSVYRLTRAVSLVQGASA